MNEMNENSYVVIMAGGAGTRLWPMSRCHEPKQLHNLCSNKSLLQEIFGRLKTVVPPQRIYVSLGKEILERAQKQLPELAAENFIVEPCSRNTGPANAYVAAYLYKINPKAVVLTLPSDQAIEKEKNFHQSVGDILDFTAAHPNYLAILGIKPTAPETGYGYIEIGEELHGTKFFQVRRFLEKPDRETALKYLHSGKYLWNGGYFCFQADQMLSLYQKLAPEIHQIIVKISHLFGQKGSETEIAKLYETMPVIQIDYAIAEKAGNLAVLPADLGWSDIGNWAALYEFLHHKTGKKIISRGNHLSLEDENCLVYAGDKLLTTVGLKDIIIVDTPDVTLICHKDHAQDVKAMIEKLKGEGKNQYL